MDIIRLYLTTATYLASKEIEIGEKTQNEGYYTVQGHLRSSNVIEVDANRKPVCDFLLVINSNWHPISYRFGDIAAYYSNFGHFAFLSHRLGGGLRDNVRCSSWAHWKVRSGLPISDNGTFFARCYGWGATSENENRRFYSNAVSLTQNFRWKGTSPTIIFARIVRPMHALQLCRWQFSHK